jgi:hypothetical protein
MKTVPAGTPSAAANPATGLTARSRALLQFCGIHGTLLALVMAGLHLRIAPAPWLPVLLIVATAVNGWNLWRKLRAARSQPPAVLVPRRIRMHLRLLAGVRGLLWIGLGAVMFGLCYLLIAGPRQQMPAIVTLLACPVVLAMKLRWLGAWERRLRKKSDALAD